MTKSRVALPALWALITLAAFACGNAASDAPAEPAPAQKASSRDTAYAALPQPEEGQAVATFAGGCFWCMEKPFDDLDGVLATTSGYAGGELERPSYKQVSSGETRHLEVVQVLYDPDRVSYEKLLDVFWRNVDPFDDGGQFCDRGYQYTTAIFTHGEDQREAAEASKQEVAERFDQPIATDVRSAAEFYPAEEYHQNFYEKQPLRYGMYRSGCGRDRTLENIWGDEAGGHAEGG